MSWDILPKGNLQYFLTKLKGKLDLKVDAVTGKGLSTNDYTTAEKDLVATIPDKADASDVDGVKTVTGNPITLTDGSETYAEELSVDLEPIQDLHGYDKPWVGGAGKNYVDYSNEHSSSVGNTHTFNQYTGELKVVWASGNAHQLVLSVPNGGNLAGKTVTLSYGTVTTSSSNVADWRIFLLSYVNGGSETIVAQRSSGTASSVTINIASNVTELRLLFRLSQSSLSQSGDYVIWNKVQIEEGSTATAYEPYENISPIQGYDIVSVDRCGKNLINPSEYIGRYEDKSELSVTVNGNALTIYAPTGNNRFLSFVTRVVTGQTYTLSLKTTSAQTGGRLNFSATKPTVSALYTGEAFTVESGLSKTFTASNEWLEIMLEPSGASGTATAMTLTEFQLEQGSTATTYEPYNGQTVSLQLGNKNLLPMTVEGIKAANTSGTWSGNVYTLANVSFTVLTNENGCVTGIKANASTAASANTTFYLGEINKGDGDKYINGMPATGSGSTFLMAVYVPGGSAFSGRLQEVYGTGDTSFNGDSDSRREFMAIGIASGYTPSNLVFKPMLRKASVVDPTFSPYNPSLGGMVYGATVDVANGVMVVDKASVDLGSFEWDYNNGTNHEYFITTTTLPNSKSTTNDTIYNAICSGYKLDTHTNVYNHTQDGIISVTRLNVVSIYDTNSIGMTASQFKSYVTGQQLVYELATPITIPLTPAQLKLLKGYNYISSNGITIHLTYQPDNAVGDAVSEAEKYTDRAIEGKQDRDIWNYSRNLWDMTGFLKATGWSKISDNSYTGSNASIHYNNYSAYIQNAHDVLDRTSLYGENFTASFDLKSANSDAPSLYLGFVITNTNGVERYIDTGNINTNCHVELTTNCNKDERVTGIYFSKAYDRTIVISNFQLERGSSPHVYEPYIPTNAELYNKTAELQKGINKCFDIPTYATAYVDLKPYTAQNMYKCPADGIVVISINQGETGFLGFAIYPGVVIKEVYGSADHVVRDYAIVKKGMSLYHRGSANGTLNYYYNNY